MNEIRIREFRKKNTDRVEIFYRQSYNKQKEMEGDYNVKEIQRYKFQGI